MAGPYVPHVGKELDLVPFGWHGALRGRYVSWYGEGLHSMSWLPPFRDRKQSRDQFVSVMLWRDAWFALRDRSWVEMLKRLKPMQEMEEYVIGE
ncbi:hypothetical protein NEMBOFW57_001481 [Staphylotrichum longicolle]|uniref:Uncharacterized protein n=1 Tax=Staphylotrichum longicolle TaxID=669026 RepID=A0AAD4F1J8_9PEZI|nr:hypothetical protein NEMBOFW57_001481 [Staphylotrichum longicolle]